MIPTLLCTAQNFSRDIAQIGADFVLVAVTCTTVQGALSRDTVLPRVLFCPNQYRLKSKCQPPIFLLSHVEITYD